MHQYAAAFGLAVALATGSGIANAQTQAVPDSIAAEGVPPVPAELTQSLARYQNSRSAVFQGWVGGRREILILTRFADTNQVHRVAFPGGDRSQVTFLNERVTGASPQPGTGPGVFAYSADEGGAENYQVFLQDPATGQASRLSDGRSRHVLAEWSNSGSKLAWSSNARNGKDMDLYVVDITKPNSVRLFKEVSGDWAVTDWSPDDKHVVAVESISINEDYVHIIDVETGETQDLTPRPKPGEETVAYSDVRWSKDGKSLYGITDLESEFKRLVRYDIATKELTRLSADIPWNVDAFDLSDDGQFIALVTDEDGISRLRIRDAEGRERPAPKLPAGQIAGLKFRKGSREFAFTLTSARSTADVYSYDLASGILERWTKSETGGINPEAFSEPELIRFPSFDGKSIPAFVYRPDPTKFPGKRPVLIDIHGGPESQFRPGYLARANYLINELGIALVYPNVRGSDGYGKTYLKLDNGMKREDSVKDIGALLDHVAKDAGFDASRVAVVGGSYGGYMSLASLTHYSDRLKAGIDVVGISNFVTFLQNTQGYRRDLRRAEYGDERVPEMRKHLEAISPLTNASKIGVPLLVVQGKNDPRVPVTESEQIVAKVKTNGKPVWYILGKDEGHGFAKKKNQDYLQAAQILFLKTYLLGEGS